MMAPGTKRVLSFCTLTMGMTMMHSAFNFYYVKVFLNRYNIKESWFHLSQVLYMVWNAINDPLFAVLQDNTSFFLTRTRREGILYTAPVFALTFLIPWFQFGDSPAAVGLHLMASLFLYDTMFTFVGLLSSCLFTELSADQHSRLKLARYSTVASLIGSQSIFVLEYMSSSLQDFRAFQLTAVGIACCSCVLMIYTGLNAHTQFDVLSHKTEEHLSETHMSTKEKDNDGRLKEESSLRKMLQILTNSNFVAFVVTNFFQEFHRSFIGGFTAIVCEYLVTSEQVPVGVRSVFYGVTGICGPILVILGAPMVARLGYFRIFRYSFIWKVGAGLVMYFVIGASNAWLIMLFILLDTAFANAAFSLFNMPLSDIVDHDQEKYNRRHPISSTAYGSNALVVKPSQSLCPMLVVGILNRYGYEQLKKGSGSAAEVSRLTQVMFQLVCFFPVIIGILQSLSWSRYTIRCRIVERETPVATA